MIDFDLLVVVGVITYTEAQQIDFEDALRLFDKYLEVNHARLG